VRSSSWVRQSQALVLSLKRLPLPQNFYPSVTKDLVGTGHHSREGDWRRFLLGARLEPRPNTTSISSSVGGGGGGGVGARCASGVTPSVRSGCGSPS
jgi:hypothetical protein